MSEELQKLFEDHYYDPNMSDKEFHRRYMLISMGEMLREMLQTGKVRTSEGTLEFRLQND